MHRFWGWLAALGSAVAAVIGAASLKWYVWDVVVRQAGEPDRSMVFWGLPIAFLGATALVVAAVLAWTARSLLRRRDS